ncbi:MAG: type II toxin-antitoxin system prevent-host-death family antitoxin [Pseudohongiellaceae bacterium]
MQRINVRETREKLSNLLDAVAAGEEVVILRHGRPVARLMAPDVETVRFPDRSALRASLPARRESAAAAVRSLRDEERY